MYNNYPHTWTDNLTNKLKHLTTYYFYYGHIFFSSERQLSTFGKKNVAADKFFLFLILFKIMKKKDWPEDEPTGTDLKLSKNTIWQVNPMFSSSNPEN